LISNEIFEILKFFKKIENLKFLKLFEILKFFENFELEIFFFIDFRILKFYEIFERVVSLLRHAMGCLPGNNRVVTQ
jgi:hypothetical protein